MYICNYKVHFHAYYIKIAIRNVSLSLSADTYPTHYRREKKTKKSKVIKAYKSIFSFFFFVCFFPCLSEIFGWFVCAFLQADSQINGLRVDLKGSLKASYCAVLLHLGLVLVPVHSQFDLALPGQVVQSHHLLRCLCPLL